MRRLFILINLILLLAVLMFLAGCSRAKDPKEISDRLCELVGRHRHELPGKGNAGGTGI